MADFSFSFDSDNPFAEPEPAPPKASGATDETPVIAGENTAAPTGDATSANEEFDPFDFAFDEGTSINDTLPTRNTPLDEATPRPLTPGEAAFAEFDFSTLQGDETPLETKTPARPGASATPLLQNAIESEAPAKTAAKSAPSDLEEFNALAFDLGPADEMFSDATSSASNESATDAQAECAETEFAPEPEAGFPLEPASEPQALHAVVGASGVQGLSGIEEGQTEGEFRRLKTKTVLSVAILGASGIGKNHARWFHSHGCRIAGILGTSPDSTERAEAELSAQFPFQGNTYTELEALLQTEKPDIVCVATPPPLHFGHVLQSLEAGAHVLCEKPLVYAPTRKFRENRDGAKELVKVAAKRNLNLGTQLQYGAATPILCKLAGLSPSDVGDFAMELETLNPNSPREPRDLWIDVGPHPVSVAQVLAGPGAHLAEETVSFESYQNNGDAEVLARFGINCADGRLLMVRAVVRVLAAQTARAPRRRFSFNGQTITYVPLTNARGTFQAQYIAPDGYSSVYADPVDYLVGNFINACRNDEAPLITGDFGRENLEWMLKVATPSEAR